jgi:hypothetical protein
MTASNDDQEGTPKICKGKHAWLPWEYWSEGLYGRSCRKCDAMETHDGIPPKGRIEGVDN